MEPGAALACLTSSSSEPNFVWREIANMVGILARLAIGVRSVDTSIGKVAPGNWGALVNIVIVAKQIVWPSGAAREAACAATKPFAPARVSTTELTPYFFCKPSATILQIVSPAPPGEKPLSSVICEVGFQVACPYDVNGIAPSPDKAAIAAP